LLAGVNGNTDIRNFISPENVYQSLSVVFWVIETQPMERFKSTVSKSLDVAEKVGKIAGQRVGKLMVYNFVQMLIVERIALTQCWEENLRLMEEDIKQKNYLERVKQQRNTIVDIIRRFWLCVSRTR